MMRTQSAQPPIVPDWRDQSRDCQRRDWQAALRLAIRDVRTLCQQLELPSDCATSAAAAAGAFPLLVPYEFLARMRPGDPRDPLLRQVLPLDAEMRPVPGYTHDPLFEQDRMVLPGLIQKYAGRVLMVVTGSCAVHCRYCFRRHFPYEAAAPRGEAWRQALRRLADETAIDEVLLSGGDPLLLPDAALRRLIQQLAEIPHLARVRLHTRLPIVIPQRVTPHLVETLSQTRLTSLVVVHANHPQELDEPVLAAIGQLVAAGIPVLNQTVLLRGINDNEQVLWELCQRLINARIHPYYLHQLDPVSGAAHFEVPVSRGKEIMAFLRGKLPGYGIPRYVQEQAGEASKTVLA